MGDNRDQPPRGGCVNCGGAVRTRKSNGWVCADCERRLSRRLTESERRWLDGDR